MGVALPARDVLEDERGVILALTKLATDVGLSSANERVVGRIGVVCALVGRFTGGVPLYPASFGAGEARVF